MAKVDASRYGSQKKTLTADMIEGDTAIMTIEEVEDVNVGDRTEKVIRFAEFPEYTYWMTRSGIRTLVAKLGDDDEDWPGHQVPMEKVEVNNPSTGRKVEKLYPVSVEEWDEVFEQAKGSRGKKKRGK